MKWDTDLEDPEGTLVTHAHQAAQGQLQHHGAFEGHKVPHVLQQEELGSVVVAVTGKKRRRYVSQKVLK